MKGDTKYNNHTKLLLKEYEELKNKFSKCKTYTNKLIFWDNNNLKHYIYTYPNEFPFQLLNERDELKKKYSITIRPNTPEEEKIYTHWRIEKKLYELINDYHTRLENKKTKSEKKDFINIQLKDVEKLESDNSSDVANSFRNQTKGIEVILGNHNFLYWNKIIEGIAKYHFKHFLIEEQTILTSPEAIKKINPKNKKLIWNSNINVLGDILYQLKKELRNENESKLLLEGDNEIIAEMICNYFSNINSKETIIDCLNQSKRTTTFPKKFRIKLSRETKE